MKGLFIIYTLIACKAFSQGVPAPLHIDPTGTYTLKGRIKKNHITGNSGEIRIQLQDSNRLAICFYMNNGYPDNQSVTFIDTLPYDFADNQVRYTPRKSPDCTLLLNFTGTNVTILPLYNNPPCLCAFNQGVMISTVFKKSSSDKPVIQDLAVHRITD
jgi:hypothetical protein